MWGKNSSHLEDIIDEEIESSTDLDLTHIVTMSFVDEPIEDVIYLSVSMNSLENNHLPIQYVAILNGESQDVEAIKTLLCSGFKNGWPILTHE